MTHMALQGPRILIVAIAVTIVVVFVLYKHSVSTMQSSKPPLLSGRKILDTTVVSRRLQPPSKSSAMKNSERRLRKVPRIFSKSGITPRGASRERTLKIPYMGNYNCNDSMCTEFLSPKYTYKCAKRNASDFKPVNGSCHFMNGTNRAPVALVSFPGSGNTWVRGLLEQATGICTGAVYCDGSLRNSGFIGEGYTSGAVIAVKTHSIRASWSNSTKLGVQNGPPWGSAILIIRNPRDALVAEWNRELAKRLKRSPLLQRQSGSNHIKYVGANHFGDNTRWGRFVKTRIKGWANYFIGWVLSATHRRQQLLVVKYEKFKAGMLDEVKKMLNFLGVPFSEEVLKKRMSEGFETFHRSHPKEIDYFTSEQEQYVREHIANVVALLKTKNNGNTLGVEEYL